MILGAELGLLVFGIWSLLRGKVTVFGGRAVYGMPARLMGLLALTPIPLSMLVGIVITFILAPGNPERFVADNKWAFAGLEAGILILVVVVLHVIGKKLAIDPDRHQSTNRGHADGDENDGERSA